MTQYTVYDQVRSAGGVGEHGAARGDGGVGDAERGDDRRPGGRTRPVRSDLQPDFHAADEDRLQQPLSCHDVQYRYDRIPPTGSLASGQSNLTQGRIAAAAHGLFAPPLRALQYVMCFRFVVRR